MAGTLRLLALLAFVLAIVAAIPPATARIARVPWVPIGLALWVWAELAAPGGLDLDLD
jgi:hypothetical protein